MGMLTDSLIKYAAVYDVKQCAWPIISNQARSVCVTMLINCFLSWIKKAKKNWLHKKAFAIISRCVFILHVTNQLTHVFL